MADFKQTTEYFNIENAHFYYVMAKTPDYGFNPKKINVKDLPKSGHRWKVDVCMSKAEMQAFTERHPYKKVTKLEAEDFIKIYKVDAVPFPEQALQYVVTFKQKVYTNKGEDMPESLRPTVQMDVSGKREDVTQTVNIGNGSQGIMKYSVWTRTAEDDPTLSFYTMLVTNLVPYEEKAPKADPRAF